MMRLRSDLTGLTLDRITHFWQVKTMFRAFLSLQILFCFQMLMADPPNILYIMTDDHSYQTYAAYGGPLKDIVKTPNLDSIANEGMRFDRCYVTNSLCGPSRATILTGKHSHANGFYANSRGQVFDGSQTTFPKVLQANGYQTALVGKWHLVSHPTGFDFWEIQQGQGLYYNPIFIGMDGKKFRRQGYNSDLVVDRALWWLKEKRDPSKPFMLMVHFKGVHSEWHPALRHANMYDNVKFPLPETFYDDYKTRGSAARNQEMTIAKHMEDYRLILDAPPNSMSPEEKQIWREKFAEKDAKFLEGNPSGKELIERKYQRYMQNYCATLACVDENVGRLLDFLKQNGLDENTVVIYTSDQGFYMGEHGWFDKRFMYEESFRTPLAIRWKGVVKPNSKTDALVQNLDFAETILDIAGCPIPEEMQGISFKAILQSDGKVPSDWRKSLYYHYYEWPAIHMVMRHDGVIMGSEKLLEFYPIGEREYYDLSDDPNELNNRITDPSKAKRVEILSKELKRLREFYKVPEADKYEPELLKSALKEKYGK